MRAAVLLAGILFLGVMSLASAQVIYKWVDDEGVTHFSAQPPRDVDARRTPIRLQQPNRQALQTRISASAERNAAAAARRHEKSEQATENRANATNDRKERAENCEKAKKRQVEYSTARRLYRQLENGERDYLTDDELDKERAGAQALVNEWCD